MGLLVTTVAGLILWIVLWTIDVGAFDAFMITIAMIFLALGARTLAAYGPGRGE